MPVAEPEKAVELDVNTHENRNKVFVTAIEKAKAKNARLRLMKERNENYLAERRDENEGKRYAWSPTSWPAALDRAQSTVIAAADCPRSR